MTRTGKNNNNLYAWLIIGIISVLVIVIIYKSVKGVKTMTHNEKVKSLKRTLNDLKDRLDINSKNEEKLTEKLKDFVETLA